MATDQQAQKNHKKVVVPAVTSPEFSECHYILSRITFYDFCCYLSVAVNSYRRGTARRAVNLLANSCYVSLGMGDRIVSNSKSDLQHHQGR